MDLHAVIYHTKGCQKCRLTKKIFEDANVPVTTILIDPDTEFGTKKSDRFKTEGYKSFPVVRVYLGIEDDGSEWVDSWSDLQLNKVRYWIKRFTTQDTSL